MKLLDKIIENMKDMGWKGLDDFDKKELLKIHQKGIEDLFAKLQNTEDDTDSLGFMCDFIQAFIMEVK